MSKGNGKFAAVTSREDMERRVETARDCHRRQKDAAAEAVAEAYLLHRETRDGMGKNKPWSMMRNVPSSDAFMP